MTGGIRAGVSTTSRVVNAGVSEAVNLANSIPGATTVNNAGNDVNSWIGDGGHDVGCFVTGEWPGSFGKGSISNALIDSGALALGISGELRKSAKSVAEDDGPEGLLIGQAICASWVGATKFGPDVLTAQLYRSG